MKQLPQLNDLLRYTQEYVAMLKNTKRELNILHTTLKRLNVKLSILQASEIPILRVKTVIFTLALGPHNSHPNADRVKTFSTSAIEASTQ